MSPSAAVVVPVKAFARAKARLAPRLGERERAALAEGMATGVVRAAAPLPVLVVCDDDTVAVWAAAHGAEVLRQRRPGLDAAVAEAVAALAAVGIEVAVVSHGDLPHPSPLAPLAEAPGVTIVPDRRRDGTNVLVVPTGCGFRFAYGPGSFHRHLLEAERLAVPVRVVADEGLSWDVDEPDDLTVELLGGWTP